MSDQDTTEPITNVEADNEPDYNLDTGEAITEGTTSEETDSTNDTTSTDNESTDSTETSDDTTDEATDTDTSDEDTEGEAETAADDTPDLSSMTRAERKEYFEGIRRQQERESAQAVTENYQPQSVDALKDAYLNEGYTEFEATMMARDMVREQQAQIAQAAAEVAQFNASIEVDAVEARAKYDWMNPDKPDSFDKGMAEMAAKLFSQGATFDPRTGQLIDAKMTPSQVADLVNGIYENGTKKASVKAQRAAEQQMAAVAPPTSTRQPIKAGNSLKDMEDRLKDIEF